MAVSSKVRTTAGLSAVMALILVLAFGNQAYHDWAVKNAGGGVVGIFLHALAWPTWRFSTDASIRDLIAADITAVLVVVFTYMFVTLLELGAGAGIRRTVGQIFAGWGGFIFAGAFAGLIGSLIAHSSSFVGALISAEAGGAYGLLIGWLVGLITLAAAGSGSSA
ncbi:MAG TPA: hypothetical protein VKB69_06690 [Micromonosporaceae bacterium]|nr:hypothetical protein [Micromonosporaceae bacterium]